jgi:single-stranded-DNA-specific exonuclease
MSLYTKIVGVTHDNANGQNRQAVISRLSLSSRISLKRDYGNIYDPNAITVVDAEGNQLGFLTRDLASQLAPHMDEGKIITATISNLTGGDNGYTRGVNIHIETS